MKLRPAPTRAATDAHVEVVVPCYNYGHFLPQCVESIVTQTGVRVTVTIIDDASTDGSVHVARRLADQHENVTLIENRENLGAVPTFNVGLSRVTADYVVLISADDMLTPGSLHRAASLMDAHPQVGFVYGHATKFVDELPPFRPPLPMVSWTLWSGTEWLQMHLRRSWNNISSPEVMVRTAVQHQVGYYSEALPRTHDVEMWLRLAAVADVAHINGIDQAFYRRHADSHSSQFTGFDDVRERWRAYARFLTQSAPAELDRFHQHVPRKLSAEVLRDLLDLLDEYPAADPGEVRAALDLAVELDPQASTSPAWADIELALAGHEPARSTRRRGALRAAARRMKWRRWRRFRYFG